MPSIINDESAPIGAIQSALLTEAQFQAQFGTSWVLADGRNVAGSKYATITLNATIPDLRGMVLRGKNNGRGDGNQDPDGERAVGSFQGHQFGSHNHGGGVHNHPHGSSYNAGGSMIANDRGYLAGGDLNKTDGSFAIRNSAAIIASNGGNETRMSNVAVNHFIKIN